MDTVAKWNLFYVYEGWYESNVSIFFFRKYNFNNSEMLKNESYIVWSYEAIFPQQLHHIQHTFANVE
jgi:hypothetical protein